MNAIKEQQPTQVVARRTQVVVLNLHADPDCWSVTVNNTTAVVQAPAVRDALARLLRAVADQQSALMVEDLTGLASELEAQA